MNLYENGHCKSCAQIFFFSCVTGVFMTYCREALNFVPSFFRGLFRNFLIFAQELDIVKPESKSLSVNDVLKV